MSSPILEYQLTQQTKTNKIKNINPNKIISVVVGLFIIFLVYILYQQLMGQGYKDRLIKQNINHLAESLRLYKSNHSGKLPPKYIKAWRKEFLDSDYIKEELINPIDNQPYQYVITTKDNLGSEEILARPDSDKAIFIDHDATCNNENQAEPLDGSVSFRVKLSSGKLYCLSQD